MAVTIAELLGAVHDHLDQRRAAGVDANSAADAAAALNTVGRALDLLYGYRPYAMWDDETRPIEAATLTSACVEAARSWPGEGARVTDLLGAVADAVGIRARTFTGEQRWALTESLAVTTRRCIDTARQFAPYAHIGSLEAARAAAVACERRATVFPASAADHTALDCLIPGGRLGSTASERIIDAAASLHNAICGRGYYPRLCMAELLITVNAAHLATAHAARELPSEAPGAAAPLAWRAARVECSGFDDGTKLRPPESSKVAAAAARLGRALLDHFGRPPDQVSPPAIRDPNALAVLHAVVHLLPDIASHLDHATWAWSAERTMWAPERRLLSYEDRNEVAIPNDGYGRAEREDLNRLRHTLTLSRSLTVALGDDLRAAAAAGPNLTPMRLSHEPDTSARSAREVRYLSIQAQSAYDSLRRAHLVNPTEWTRPVTGASRSRPS